MSIVASVKVHDGVVLGADGMTQIVGANAQGVMGSIKSYEHAQKLFQLGENAGVTTYGIGNIGPRSIGSFISEFARERKSGFATKPVEEIAGELLVFLLERYEEAFKDTPGEQRQVLGLLVAGYSAEGSLAEEWEFIFPRDTKPIRVRQLHEFGASWRGFWWPMVRLYRAHDPTLPQALQAEGFDEAAIAKIKGVLDRQAMQVIFDGMPLQDALDFATFILEVTVGASRFHVGASACGGPLSVAVITRDKGFEWIREPKLRSR